MAAPAAVAGEGRLLTRRCACTQDAEARQRRGPLASLAGLHLSPIVWGIVVAMLLLLAYGVVQVRTPQAGDGCPLHKRVQWVIGGRRGPQAAAVVVAGAPAL